MKPGLAPPFPRSWSLWSYFRSPDVGQSLISVHQEPVAGYCDAIIQRVYGSILSFCRPIASVPNASHQSNQAPQYPL